MSLGQSKAGPLRVHTWPEKILKVPCREVEEVDDTIRKLLDEMLVLMRIHDGVGLAGNQAGLSLRLVVIEANDRTFKLVNPRIVRREGEINFSEGCLSFPGLELLVKRSKKIWVKALSEKGEPLDLEIEGVMAVVFQHEIDHIDGIPFIERVSLWQKIKASSKLKEIARRTKDELSKQKQKS